MLKNTIIASDIRFSMLPNYTVIEPVYHTVSGISSKQLNDVIRKSFIYSQKYCQPSIYSRMKNIQKKKSLPESFRNQDLNLPPANSYTLYPQLFTLHACSIRDWK